MDLEPLRRLFSDRTFLSLDVPLARGLVPIAYVLGLLGILIWALQHLVWRFAQGWPWGIWGVVEVLGFGALLVLAARIASEALLVVFKERAEREAEPSFRPRITPSMLEEVNEAIQDLGEDEPVVVEEKPTPPPARTRRSTARPIAAEPSPKTDEPPRNPPVRRTARRSSPPAD